MRLLHQTILENYLKMFDPNFNPYDVLANLSDRMNQIEAAHNRLCRAFEQLEKNTKIIEARLKNMEDSHIALASHVFKAEINDLVK